MFIVSFECLIRSLFWLLKHSKHNLCTQTNLVAVFICILQSISIHFNEFASKWLAVLILYVHRNVQGDSSKFVDYKKKIISSIFSLRMLKLCDIIDISIKFIMLIF